MVAVGSANAFMFALYSNCVRHDEAKALKNESGPEGDLNCYTKSSSW